MTAPEAQPSPGRRVGGGPTGGPPTALEADAVAASSDAADFQSDEGGSQPTLLLQLPDLDFGAPRWAIRPVNGETSRRWFATYHYLGDPASAALSWGVFAPDLAAIVMLGLPNNEHGVATRLGLTAFRGNVELSRLAVHPEFPAERSRVIRRVLIVAAQDLDWVFAYADPKAGHHGGIYQALGAVYCGLSPSYTGWRGADGTMLHPRSAVSAFGTQAQAAMSDRGYEPVQGAFGGLHTYILPLRQETALRAVLAPHARPYPKRLAA